MIRKGNANMKKLVVCDVDGTLLNMNNTVIDRRILELIKTISDKNVFAVSSGRTYGELLKLFDSVKDRIYFVILDGSAVCYKDRLMFSHPLDNDKIRKFYKLSGKNCTAVYYGLCNNYLINCGERIAQDKSFIEINSPDEIKEEIYKISLYGYTAETLEKTDKYISNNRLFRKIYDNGLWHDYIGICTDKKNGIEYIKNEEEISYNNTYVFGDNYNDTGLLRCGRGSYVMKNAPMEIKRIAKYEITDIVSELEKIALEGME